MAKFALYFTQSRILGDKDSNVIFVASWCEYLFPKLATPKTRLFQFADRKQLFHTIA
jgi:hypothetical protein